MVVDLAAMALAMHKPAGIGEAGTTYNGFLRHLPELTGTSDIRCRQQLIPDAGGYSEYV
ncbi:uncharacterized protein FOMMEDRAFT_154757 [Fomitiporia mediterranea MF3/22]|uniref:uncharacterized protein n=1 Tax=Fomitiporia mediterranea (strain MF3/22) TaxID=694068 RepID=UPI0004409050|nr:uncharacterized protein FOMMEDRAFT_154757 [Fomitiporia mediterranea MF3/22]EJD03654.1 hypothetical protein FOMMEDRAFT_154757 [Fomitiporia mediterranea MF3/22]